MKFQIGGHTYRLIINPDPCIDSNGNECRGEVVTKQRTINLYAPERDRIDVFLHEYWHLWQHHLGRELDERECDIFATAVTALLRDLATQGGVLSLLAIGSSGAPVGPEASDFAPPANCGPRYCACGQTIASGSVICKPGGVDFKTQMPTVIVHFYCDFCDKVMRSCEAATIGNKPTGIVLEQLKPLTGDEAHTFCSEHAERIGASVHF